jgi:RNA-directed DNA polymerase
MMKTPIRLQDLRRRIYAKAKTETTWRFWGLYVHVCKRETLYEAYTLAKRNDGAPGIDGVTFSAIEEGGVDGFLDQIRDELVTRRYRPMRNRRKEIPKDGGKVRVLGIPAIRDRVVQGALKLILEPIFEADFQPGSIGYRPNRQAREAVHQIDHAVVWGKTRVIDIDLRAYFDNVRHHIVLSKLARRIDDPDVMHLLSMILAATGKKGVPQGGVISPLLSNVYLNDVDRMLERAREVTRRGEYTHLEYARYADDVAILVDHHPRNDWLVKAVSRRLRAELGKLQVEVNEEKSRIVDLTKGESFGFLGFDYRLVRSRASASRAWHLEFTPKMKKRTALLKKLREVFERSRSQPVTAVIPEVNRILEGWVNYFRIGHADRCFAYVRDWVEKRVRRHLMRNSKRRGFGWNRWSRRWLYVRLGLFDDYRVRPRVPQQTALPDWTVT